MNALASIILTSGAIKEIYAYILWGGCCFFVIQAMKGRHRLSANMLRSKAFLMLAAFGLSYGLIGYQSFQAWEYYFIAPIMAYVAGWIMVETRKEKPEQIRTIIVASVIGFSIHAALNVSINVGHRRWELMDFYTGSLRAATGSGSINTLAFSLLFYFFMMEKGKVRVLGVGAFVVCAIYALMLGTRTQFIILLVVNLVFLSTYLFRHYGGSAAFRLVGVLLLVSVISYIVYFNNLWGIQDIILASNLSARFGGNDLALADGNRYEYFFNGLMNLVDHPFGGQISREYFHNLWLDVGRVGGLLPFVLVVFYFVIINRHLFILFKDKACEDKVGYMILAVYLGVQMNFFVEPIMEGLLYYFLFFCMVNGAVESYYRTVTKRNRLIRR